MLKLNSKPANIAEPATCDTDAWDDPWDHVWNDETSMEILSAIAK